VCELIDREVLPAVGELAARTAAAIHERPETAPDGDGHLADTVASCDANLRMLTTLWRTGGDPRDARPPAPALAYARVYARERRPSPISSAPTGSARRSSCGSSATSSARGSRPGR
jgi:hypothetical protein